MKGSRWGSKGPFTDGKTLLDLTSRKSHSLTYCQNTSNGEPAVHSHRSTDPVLRAVAIHADTATCKTAHILRHSAARSSRRISHVRMKAQGSRAIGWQARQNAGKCTIMMQRRSGARHTIRQRVRLVGADGGTSPGPFRSLVLPHCKHERQVVSDGHLGKGSGATPQTRSNNRSRGRRGA